MMDAMKNESTISDYPPVGSDYPPVDYGIWNETRGKWVTFEWMEPARFSGSVLI